MSILGVLVPNNSKIIFQATAQLNPGMSFVGLELFKAKQVRKNPSQLLNLPVKYPSRSSVFGRVADVYENAKTGDLYAEIRLRNIRNISLVKPGRLYLYSTVEKDEWGRLQVVPQQVWMLSNLDFAVDSYQILSKT